MPRLTLQSRLFIALTALLVALLLIFAAFSRIGLQQGLGPYVAEIELARMDTLARRLEQFHGDNGGWDGLRQRPETWRELRQERPMPERQGPPPGLGDGQFGPGPRPDGPRRPGEDGPDGLFRRLGLEDAQGQPLAGEPGRQGTSARRALHQDGRLIGYLTLAPTRVHDSAADQAFLRQHLGFVAWTGLAGLMLALLLSWWLTRRWLAPVDALASGAREIAQGRLSTRVPVASDGELGTLARGFNDMAQRLEAMENSRREWLANVAHELRTPLAAMRAEIEALQDGIRAFDDKAALRLHRQVMRLIQLVNDLRASMDAPGPAPGDVVVPVHALALLGEAAAGMRERFTQAGLSLDTEPIRWLGDPHSQPCVHGEPDALHQVFVNLLENCMRYTDAGGRVVLSHDIQREDGARWLVLHFDDSAPGVAPQDMERIFERLYRGESSRSRSHGGSGLGLPICRHLLNAQGGRIEARASLLGGLRVSVMLPMLENPA